MPRTSGDDRSERQRPSPNEPAGDARDADERDAGRWFANTAVRAGLTIVGVVLLLFAIGQAFGLPLLEFTAEALSSETGRWLVVAFFALLLIGAAQQFGTAS